MKRNKVLIIPDVHGREFWKYSLKNIDKFEKVIFLGDYLDPYPDEGIDFEDAINNLRKIIELKKDNPDKVILLYGNHDLHYIDYMGKDIFPCSRYNEFYSNEVGKIFTENKDLFRLFYKIDKYVFSHAGIVKDWLINYCKCSTLGELLDNESKANGHLWVVSYLRYGFENYGSPVWSDVREFRNEFDDIFQVFGHTQLIREYFGPMIGDHNFACLDCRKCFVLDLDEKLISKYIDEDIS